MTRARDLSNLIGSGNYTSTTFTATAGQTVFTIAHTQGFIQVFMNGLLLDETTDYTSNGTAVTLTEAATAGDELEVVKYNTFSVGDAMRQSDADTRYVNTTGDTMTGGLNVDGIIKSQRSNYSKVSLANTSSAYEYQLENNGGNFRVTDTTAGGLTRVQVDSAGRVTMPYQPAFFARDGSGFNTNGYLSSFGVVQHNIGGHFNNSTGQFTAPVSGKYLFTAGVLVQTGTGRLEFKLNYNGTTIASGNGTGTTYDGPTITVIINMNVNDYIRVDRVLGTAYDNGNHSNTYFSGYLIG